MPPLPPNAPDTSREERSRIAEQRAKHNDRRIEKAAAVGVASLSALARVAPNTAAIILHSLSGFDVRKPGWKKATPFARLWALPQPFGIVPPGWYGLSPSYLRDFAPFLPESAYLYTVDDDHPSMVAWRKKKEVRAALTPGNTTIGAGSTTEAVTLMVEKGWFHKIASAATEIRRWPGDLNHWFNSQLRGPNVKGAIREILEGESAVSGAFTPPYDGGDYGGGDARTDPPAGRVQVAPDVVAKKKATVEAVAIKPVAKVRRKRRVDVVVTSRALSHRRRDSALLAL